MSRFNPNTSHYWSRTGCKSHIFVETFTHHIFDSVFSHSFSFTRIFLVLQGCPITSSSTERERDAVLLFSASQTLRVGVDRAGNKLSTAFTCPLIDLSISFSLSLSAHFTLQCYLVLPLACLHLSLFIIFYYHRLFSPHMWEETHTSCLLMTHSWYWENTSFYNIGLCHVILSSTLSECTEIHPKLKIRPSYCPKDVRLT